MKAFISYSHRDANILERLHTHLAMLKREGKLDAWYDREILAGDRFDNEISGELRSSDLFVPIVTPDFLASAYCFDKEVQAAIKLDIEGSLRIIPIIAEPCDWLSSPLSKFKVLPKDGKPISDWTNRNTAFLDIISELRRVIDAAGRGDMRDEEAFERMGAQEKKVSGSNSKYLVRRDFDEIDRADYRATAFKAIRSYLLSSSNELDQLEGVKARFKNIDEHSFTVSLVNQVRGNKTSHVTIHEGIDSLSLGDIYYSQTAHAAKNSANGILSIEADDFRLFLRELIDPSGDSKTPLTPEGAAERIWKDLLRRADISYA